MASSSTRKLIAAAPELQVHPAVSAVCPCVTTCQDKVAYDRSYQRLLIEFGKKSPNNSLIKDLIYEPKKKRY